MLSKIEQLLQLLATLTGFVVILIPLLGFCRIDVNARGQVSGAAASLLRWPMMLTLTIVYVAIGIALWRHRV